MWKYNNLLPPMSEDFRVCLGEGNTPLIHSRSIGLELGIPNLYFKLENLNPSGSYKDRFAALVVSIMKSKNQQLCLATSSGNTGAALAAYCAAAGIKCFVVVVDGAPVAKIKQMQLYGAYTYTIKGFGKDPLITDEVFKILEKLTAAMNLPIPISAYHYCPEGMQGVQTIAYEILEGLNEVDHVFSPAGGGGLTLAIGRGVIRYGKQHKLSRIPKIHCVQPEGNDTIASPLRYKKNGAQRIKYATTAISGLQVPNVVDGDETVSTCRLLGGNGYVVSDREIFNWQKKLAQQEGIFCEPAGAVSLAGLALSIQNKEVKASDKVVCLITGSGFKDMLSIDKNFGLSEIQTIPITNLYDIINDITN